MGKFKIRVTDKYKPNFLVNLCMSVALEISQKQLNIQLNIFMVCAQFHFLRLRNINRIFNKCRKNIYVNFSNYLKSSLNCVICKYVYIENTNYRTLSSIASQTLKVSLDKIEGLNQSGVRFQLCTDIADYILPAEPFR